MTVSKFKLITPSLQHPLHKPEQINGIDVLRHKIISIGDIILRVIKQVTDQSVEVKDIFEVDAKNINKIVSVYNLSINDFNKHQILKDSVPPSYLYNLDLSDSYLFIITDNNYLLIDNDRILTYDIE